MTHEKENRENSNVLLIFFESLFGSDSPPFETPTILQTPSSPTSREFPRINSPGFGAPGFGAPGFGAPGFGAPGFGGESHRGRGVFHLVVIPINILKIFTTFEL